MAAKTIEELVNDLKCKAQTLREMEDKQGAAMAKALRTGAYPPDWKERDARILTMRRECASLRKRIMRRVETKLKRRVEKGSSRRHVAAPPPRPPLFTSE